MIIIYNNNNNSNDVEVISNENVLSGLQGQKFTNNGFGLTKKVTEQMKTDEASPNLRKFQRKD